MSGCLLYYYYYCVRRRRVRRNQVGVCFIAPKVTSFLGGKIFFFFLTFTRHYFKQILLSSQEEFSLFFFIQEMCGGYFFFFLSGPVLLQVWNVALLARFFFSFKSFFFRVKSLKKNVNFSLKKVICLHLFRKRLTNGFLGTMDKLFLMN